MSPVEMVEDETASENPVYEKDGKFYQDDTLSYRVPKDSPVESLRGQKQEVNYTKQVVQTVEQANEVMAAKEWTIVEMVNDKLGANARSNAYQAALAPHKPTKVSQDDIKERMIRDYIRLGIAEDVARAQVDALLSTK